MAYSVKFVTVIRKNNVHKSCCSPKSREELTCKMDDRNEPSEYDEHDGGVYKELVGHAPIELSSL